MKKSSRLGKFCAVFAGVFLFSSVAFAVGIGMTWVSVGQGNWASIFEDVDVDSTMDVVASDYYGSANWYRYTNYMGYYWYWANYPIQADEGGSGHTWACWSLFKADMDNANGLDIVGATAGPMNMSGARSEHLCWWACPATPVGSPAPTWTRNVVYSWSAGSGPAIRWAEPVDSDGNGSIDYFACAGGTSYFTVTTGGSYSALGTAVESTCAHPVDQDLDGDIDFIACTSWTDGNATPHAQLVCYGGGPTDLNLDVGTAFCVVDLDFDNDNDNDLVVTGNNGSSFWQNSSGTFTKIGTTSTGGYYGKKGDMDQDGNMDVVVGDKWLKGDGSGGFATRTFDDNGGTPYSFTGHFLDVGSFDGNANPDVAAAGSIVLKH